MGLYCGLLSVPPPLFEVSDLELQWLSPTDPMDVLWDPSSNIEPQSGTSMAERLSASARPDSELQMLMKRAHTTPLTNDQYQLVKAELDANNDLVFRRFVFSSSSHVLVR
jgi:hypothetical protein